MTTYIVSYFIDAEDKNVNIVLEHAIWNLLDDLDGELADSGLWYLESENTAKSISDDVVKTLEQTKVDYWLLV